MKKNWFRNAVAALIVMASLVAVAAQDDKDWVPISGKDGSITLRFPAGWALADENDPAFKAALENIRKHNPALAGTMSGSKASNSLMQVFDLNSVNNGLIDNLNVVSNPHGGLTPAMYGEVAKVMGKQLTTKGKFEHKVIDSANGKALNYWCTMIVKQGEGKPDLLMDTLGYLFLKGDKLYVVTFATGEGQLKTKRATFDKIFKTVKF